MLLSALAGAMGAFAFAVLIRVPRRDLFFAALGGLLSGFVYAAAGALGLHTIAQVLLAAVAAGALSEVLARVRRAPATVYLMPGLIPLVPGLLAYHAMYALLRGDYVSGAAIAVETIYWAAAIGVGIALVLTVSRSFQSSPPSAGKPRARREP